VERNFPRRKKTFATKRKIEGGEMCNALRINQGVEWHTICKGQSAFVMTRRFNLLVVEDDPAVREAITRALETEGYQVSSAASRSEAIRLFDQGAVDMALLDLNLGQEEGWTVFEALKERRPGLPIFLTSGRADELRHSKASKASGVLEKPFDIPVLLALLSQACLSAATPPSLEAATSDALAHPVSGRPPCSSCTDFPRPTESAPPAQVVKNQKHEHPGPRGISSGMGPLPRRKK
jgi:CheY-like chemotaxis protein